MFGECVCIVSVVKPLVVVAPLHTLKNLEVLDIGVFRVDVEFDSAHGNIEEDGIVDLTKRRSVIDMRNCAGDFNVYLPCPALFDFCDVEL